MTVTADSLDAFGQLATALGILGPSGSPNAQWFGDPVGRASTGAGNPNGLRHVLADDAQRDALIAFVDEVLGDPDRAVRGTATWVPLFRETDPQVTIYAVVEPVGNTVRLGIGFEHATTGAPPTVATRLHVPIFQLARGTSATPAASNGLPGWLLLGKPGGRISLTVDVTLRAAPPPSGQAGLSGLALTLGIPTAAGDPLAVALQLRDLQLPGAAAPQTFTLDAASLDQLDEEVFELVAGLVRAQAEALGNNPAFAPFAALTGLLGLRDVPNLPPLPLANIVTSGVTAVVDWLETVLASNAARDAWLGQLATLLGPGVTVDAARDAVEFSVGPATVALGVRVEPGAGGQLTLTPWAEIALDSRAGARARLAVDLLRASTQSGDVTAVPDLRAEAVFGVHADGPALLTGDPAVGSLHVGVALTGITDVRRPAFVLTLHDVTVAGQSHAVLDLSSPAAAVDSANAVVQGALNAALANFGQAGALVGRLLGVTPPAGIPPVTATTILADPVAAVAGYWQALAASAPSMADVLGTVRTLIAGTPAGAAPGAGTPADPWRVDFAPNVGLRLHTTAGALVVDLAAGVSTPIFADLTVDASLGLTLLRAQFSPPQATFGPSAQGSLRLRRTDNTPAHLELADLALELQSLALDVRWTPTAGLGTQFTADGLALLVYGGGPLTRGVTRVDVPLPTLDATGQLTFPSPAWDAVERAIAALAGSLDVLPVNLALDFLGWRGTGPRLRLAALFSVNPALAVEAWIADLILDCSRVRAVLGPVAALLSGFQLSAPLGTGSDRAPFRCPIAGHRRAPGLSVWLDPGCPPTTEHLTSAVSLLADGEPPELSDLVEQVIVAAEVLPDVQELLVGRTNLADGLTQLVERWTNTDGLVGAPTTLPAGVTSVVLPGYTYAELVALGSIGALVVDLFDTLPDAVVHVGCEATWTADRPAGTTFDATGATAPGAIPAAGAGTWFVRLPAPIAAAALRPDRDGVAEQAARLAAVLAGRTDPVVIVAYGSAGAAAVRACNTVTAAGAVATVGTPWAGLAIDSLRTGRSGDALRFLARMSRADAEVWSDHLLGLEATPLQAVREATTRALAATDLTAFSVPSAELETRRAGLEVRAGFGSLSADTLTGGVAALIADGIVARLEAARAALGVEPPHTALHVALDVPAFDLDLDGLLVGAGATFELATLERTAGGGIAVQTIRALTVDVRIGVHDGWLVGGPGAAANDAELRWMTARVRIPFDGSPGSTELTLHEARAFSVFRERWTVRADADGTVATTPLPEVRVMLAGAVARIRAASAPLATLLDRLGLTRDGGLDPTALDRLVYDPELFVADALADPAALAAALRGVIPGATGAGTVVSWDAAPGLLSFDLVTRSVTASIARPLNGLPPLSVAVSASLTGASATFGFGALDPVAGGIRLVGEASTIGAGAVMRLEWQTPGAPAPRLVPLLPTPDPAGLQALAAAVLPAALAQQLAEFGRTAVSNGARPAFDDALDTLGLLTPADVAGLRRVRLPLALFDDPGAYLRHGLATWRADPVGNAVRLLDDIRPLVAPGPGTPGTWPIAAGVAVQYASDAGRLRLAIDADFTTVVDGHTVTAGVVAGLSIGPTGGPALALTAGLAVDARGIEVTVAPDLRIALLRPAPAVPLELYPNGPGLGNALAAIGESVIPPVVNAITARRSDATPSLIKDVGRAVFDLAEALDLLDGTQVTAARLTSFAADPAARLVAQLPQLAATGVATLAQALDPAATVVRVVGPAAGRTTLEFGPTRALKVTLDGSGATPALVLGVTHTIPGLGPVTVEELRLAADGVRIAARLGPFTVDANGLELRPLLVLRAGVTGAGFTRMAGLGLALDAAGAQSVEVRWTLDAAPPTLALVTRTGSNEVVSTDAQVVATRLLALAGSLTGSVALAELRPSLTPRVRGLLQGVVFTDTAGSTALDATLFTDLVGDPLKLLTRLERLLWNAALPPSPLSLTIDDTVTIALVGETVSGARKRLGLSISLAPNKRFTIADGDPKVELEVDATWVNPTKPAGLSIFVVEGTVGGGLASFEFKPGVIIAGIGLRFSKASGPLLDLGAVSLDAIAVHAYGEATTTGVGGGAHLELAGFAIAPSGAGGNNAVANGILSEASAAGQSNRPAFSPSLAVQKHPGRDLGVSFRAGPPPGPWFVTVQRQLGPLYLERIGLDTAEQNGRVSRIGLIFDGRVSLFGLTAAVEGLSLTWLGGDVFKLDQWAVDLQGLAVSADMSGVSLAGGLLKTVTDGQPGYVGMLLGRFGVYGLTVFGGYTNQNGSPSFFVFGAFNGPIGGPPAFFLTGIGGGLGINRGLRTPTDLARFNEYPFIQALDPAASVPEPMQKLRELTEYFPPQLGNFWFAAGISFTCFALVDGIAVVAVSFGEGLEINLFGLARMALPRPQAALVSIELGLLARFSTVEGIFSIRAQLTDNSWLLYEDVRLTGGFAFVVWWKGPNAGQFVLTIGGYHPDFRREGYPEVPRLGLTWRVTDEIVIKGGSYFALTSEALMAGVDVEVSADFGWAWARIAFGAHGIVYFDPFWFEVSAYARISAGVKIKTFLGTVRFGISLGARIRVWGPDFSGEAVIEVGPAEFSVGFGSERRVEPRVLEWAEFTGKYLEDAGGGRARALTAITGRGTLPTPSTDGQKAPTADGTRARPFDVYAEFEVTVTTTVPTSRFDINAASGPVSVTVKRSDGAAAPLGLKPMKAFITASTLRLTLERLNGNAATPVPAQLQLLAAHHATTTDAFPIGAWGVPDTTNTHEPPLPRGDVLFAGNSVRLEAVATQLNRGPEIDYYRVEAGRRPLPLQAGGTVRSDFLALAAAVSRPAVATAAQALLAAEAELFAPRTAAVPAGVLPLGTPTRLGRAAYAGDRAAPPLFGALTDGLAPLNGSDGSASKQPAPPAKQPPAKRPARVAAWLAAGAGVQKRDVETTVADRRLKRRAAPTLSSVQSRLALHLPVQLLRTAPPAADAAKTVVPLVTPRTEVPGATRSYVAGRAGGLHGLDAIVGGLGRSARAAGDVFRRDGLGRDGVSRDGVGRDGARAAGDPQLLGSGDFVVLTLPDASIDPDDGGPRPALGVRGSARVTLVRGDGFVLEDEVAAGQRADARVAIPPGTALVAVQSDGRLDVTDGLAGWHEHARVAALGTSVALADGCTLCIEAATTVPSVGWVTAADAVRGAAAVTTRFDRSVQTLVVVLADADPERVDGVQLELTGATRVRGKDGEPRPPVVVLAGDRAALVYAVDPGDDGPVFVRVAAGGDWQVTGVLAGPDPVDRVARLLAERGVAAVAGRVLAGSGEGCTVRWIAPGAPTDDPARRRGPSPNDRPARTTGAAKTSTARSATKTSAAKTSASKSTAKKAPARKSARKTTATSRGTDGRR